MTQNEEARRWMYIYDTIDKARNNGKTYVVIHLTEDEENKLRELEHSVTRTQNGAIISTT